MTSYSYPQWERARARKQSLLKTIIWCVAAAVFGMVVALAIAGCDDGPGGAVDATADHGLFACPTEFNAHADCGRKLTVDTEGRLNQLCLTVSGASSPECILGGAVHCRTVEYCQATGAGGAGGGGAGGAGGAAPLPVCPDGIDQAACLRNAPSGLAGETCILASTGRPIWGCTVVGRAECLEVCP